MSLAILQSKMHQSYTKIVLGSVPEDKHVLSLFSRAVSSWLEFFEEVSYEDTHQDNYSFAFFFFFISIPVYCWVNVFWLRWR